MSSPATNGTTSGTMIDVPAAGAPMPPTTAPFFRMKIVAAVPTSVLDSVRTANTVEVWLPGNV
jgi:hypothetical protein